MAAYSTDSDQVAMAQATPIQEMKEVDGFSAQGSLADTLVEGSEDVTHAEFDTLRHIPDSLPISSFLVVVVEFAERFSYYGWFSFPIIVLRLPAYAPGDTPTFFDRDRPSWLTSLSH